MTNNNLNTTNYSTYNGIVNLKNRSIKHTFHEYINSDHDGISRRCSSSGRAVVTFKVN